MSEYVCSACSYKSTTWFGKCPGCGEWNTLIKSDEGKGGSSATPATITPLTHVTASTTARMKTAFGELDRVLGGGLVKGGVVLIAGEPGVGKSSLLIKAVENHKTLYISGEESGSQLRGRANRLEVDMKHIDFTDNVSVNALLKSLAKRDVFYEVVVIDSIQTACCDDVASTAGSITQIKEALTRMSRYAKSQSVALIIVGHITKGGDIAGPKSLEHMVDAVLYLEGEKSSQLRLIRAHKNRYGDTDEVGVFEMTSGGLREMKNVKHVLSSSTADNAPGKATVGVPEGSRVLFYEVQTLTVPTFLASPRRVVSGINYNRLQLLLAVAQKHVKVPFDKVDVFTNVVGGVSITSPAADLGVIASAISAMKGMPLRPSSVYIGEVGLLGEVRKVFKQEKCMAEAKRYKFTHIAAPPKVGAIVDILDFLQKE